MGILFWLGVFCLQVIEWCFQLFGLACKLLFILVKLSFSALVILVKLAIPFLPILIGLAGIAIMVLLLGSIMPWVAMLFCVAGLMAPKNNQT